MLNKKYVSQANNIFSFDWVDTITQNGYITFYLSQATTSTGTVGQTIVTKPVPSQTNDFTVSGHTNNFDSSPFKYPAVMNGDIIIGGYSKATAAGSTIEVTLSLESGGVSTTIGALIEATSTNVELPWAIKIPVTNNMVKVGDFIRLKLGKPGAGSSVVGTSPMGDVGTSINNTITRVMLPFKVDLS